jgi:predicted  nucleic acid-binding Zn-ribbon protein
MELDVDMAKTLLQVVIAPAIAGLIVWINKLDGRVHDLKAEVASLQAQIQNDRDTVSKLEIRVSESFDQLRADIKEFRQQWREDIKSVFDRLGTSAVGGHK